MDVVSKAKKAHELKNKYLVQLELIKNDLRESIGEQETVLHQKRRYISHGELGGDTYNEKVLWDGKELYYVQCDNGRTILKHSPGMMDDSQLKYFMRFFNGPPLHEIDLKGGLLILLFIACFAPFLIALFHSSQ